MNDEVFIAMAKALNFCDPDELSMVRPHTVPALTSCPWRAPSDVALASI